MKNVLLWIVSVFSMLLDAVKKERQVTIPVCQLLDTETKKALLIKKGESTLLIITANVKDAKAFKRVDTFAFENDYVLVGTYTEKGKRNFVLKKRA